MEFIDMTERFKWKFFETREEYLRIEVPRGNENLVLKTNDTPEIRSKLVLAGFVEQVIKGWREP